MSDFKPKFEVVPIKEQKEVTQYRYETTKDETTGRLLTRRIVSKEKVPFGFMVYTSKGDSFRVATKERLVQLGFGNPSEVIDMDTGEVVAKQVLSLQAASEARSTRSAFRKAQTL